MLAFTAYRDLEHRKQVRDNAWRMPGWDETVLHTGEFYSFDN